MPHIDSKMIRVAEDSPDRCQAVIQHGQCPYQRCLDPDGPYCLIHSANTHRAEEKRNFRNYQLARIQVDLDKKLSSPEIKNLREEIALLRLLLEKVINKCDDDVDLVMASPKISDLVGKIQQLVTACHKIEVSSGILLDKSSILQLANLFIGIIGKYVHDIDVIDAISKEIPDAVLSLEGAQCPTNSLNS